jgi:hypothetical protein
VGDNIINSSNRKFSLAPTIIDIGNKAKINETKNCSIKVPYIRLYFYNYHSTDTIQIYFMESENNIDFDKFPHLNLKSEDKNYIEIIYCILNEGYNILPNIFGYNISPDHMRYEVIE